MSASDMRPNCAHLHVEYRNEEIERDFGPLRSDGSADGIHVPPHGVRTVRRGWWACRECGTTFVPAPRSVPESIPPVPSRPARDGETLSDEPTDAQLIDRLESALLAAKAADTEQDADEWYHLADTYSEQLADRLAALRAELGTVAAHRDATLLQVKGLLDENDALRAELADARADKEQWAAQATANAKDVLRMNWLEAAGGLYDLCCWNVDWPSVNNGWTVGSDEIDDIAKAQTAREALDEAIAARPEVLAARAASGEDASHAR